MFGLSWGKLSKLCILWRNDWGIFFARLSLSSYPILSCHPLIPNFEPILTIVYLIACLSLLMPSFTHFSPTFFSLKHFKPFFKRTIAYTKIWKWIEVVILDRHANLWRLSIATTLLIMPLLILWDIKNMMMGGKMVG